MDSQCYDAQSSYSNYTYYPPPHIPQNPYPPLNNNEIHPSSTMTNLHPPGIDPYTTPNSYHYPTTFVGNGGYEAQASFDLGYLHHQSSQVGALSTPSYYQDASYAQTFVAKDAIQKYGAPPPIVGHSPVVDSLHSNSLYPADPNNPSSHLLANDDLPRIPKMPKVLQAMRCEVCQIDCNSKDVLDGHMQGKKHKNALLLQQQASKKAIFPAYASMPQGTFGSSLVAAGGDLAMKTQKLVEGGVAVDSVMTCSICNVVCNNQVVFSAHLAGRKHASQATMLLQNRRVPTNPVPNIWGAQPSFNSAKKKAPKKPTIVQSAWCEICSIDCTSQEVLNIHRAGKKHQKNLEKLLTNNTQASTTSLKTSNPVIGPQENPSNAVKGAKKKATSEEDVETKRRKVVSSGAAADAVRVCTICNVVCNSQVVFHTHLVGQKHISMLKKHAEAKGSATQST